MTTHATVTDTDTPATTAAFFTEIRDKVHFSEILNNNPGYVILKFGAEWCGPCKTVAPVINKWKPFLSNKVAYYDIDIDVNMEIYGFLKTRKMVNGIPCVLVYKSGNTSYIPDDAALGANVTDINNLFDGVIKETL